MTKGNGTTKEAEVVQMTDYFDCFATAETERLHITPQMWVELKKELDEGEAALLDDAWMSGFEQTPAQDNGHAPSDGEIEQNVVYHTRFSRWRLLKLALFIVDWNLMDADKKTVRWPRRHQERMAMISRLSPRIATKIRTRVDELLLAQREQAAAEVNPEGNPQSAPEPVPVST